MVSHYLGFAESSSSSRICRRVSRQIAANHRRSGLRQVATKNGWHRGRYRFGAADILVYITKLRVSHGKTRSI